MELLQAVLLMLSFGGFVKAFENRRRVVVAWLVLGIVAGIGFLCTLFIYLW